MKIAYLGPAGHLHRGRAARGGARAATSSRCGRRPSTTRSSPSRRGEAERALVPFENSIEGSVRSTLDTLAFEAPGVTIVGEHDYAVRAHLIAARPLEPEEIEAVLSHPQPLAQCARYLREQLPQAERRSVSSTAEAVRVVCESERALGGDRRPRGGRALRRHDPRARGSRTRPTTSPASSGSRPPGTEPQGGGEWKTSLVFSELGEDHPGALVDALREFSSRGVNLSRIESRPMRQGLGRYMFFCDLEGALADAARLRGDRRRCDERPNRCGSWAPTRSAESPLWRSPLQIAPRGRA